MPPDALDPVVPVGEPNGMENAAPGIVSPPGVVDVPPSDAEEGPAADVQPVVSLKISKEPPRPRMVSTAKLVMRGVRLRQQLANVGETAANATGNLVKRGGGAQRRAQATQSGRISQGPNGRASVFNAVQGLTRAPGSVRASMAVRQCIAECTNDFRDANAVSSSMMDLDVLLERDGDEGALIDAGSPIHILVLRLMRIVAIWSVLQIPYLHAFKDHWGGVDRPSPSASGLWYIVFGDFMFAACLASLFFISQVQRRTGKEILDLKKIRQDLFSRVTFWLDVVSMVSTVIHCLEMASPGERTTLGFYFGDLRVLRGWRLLRNDMKGLRNCSKNQAALSEIFDLLLVTCILTHLSACVWFAVRGDPDEDESSPYIQSIYETSFLIMGQERPRSTRGTDGERIVTMVLGLTGYMYMAYFLAALFGLMSQQRVLSSMIGQKMALVNGALHSLQIPDDLQRRIVRYHDFVNVHHSPEAYDALFSGLSTPLLTELKLCLFRDLISKADFFQKVPAAQVTRLVQALEELIYSPGDFILRKGDTEEPAMFFIIRGQCELLDDRGQVLGTKISGDYFGEVSLLIPNNPRSCSARAKTYSIVARLSKESFSRICGQSTTQFVHVLENLLSLPWTDDDTRRRATDVLDAMKAGSGVAAQDPNSSTLTVPSPKANSATGKKFRGVVGKMMVQRGAAKIRASLGQKKSIVLPVEESDEPIGSLTIANTKPLLESIVRNVAREELQNAVASHQAVIRQLLEKLTA